MVTQNRFHSLRSARPSRPHGCESFALFRRVRPCIAIVLLAGLAIGAREKANAATGAATAASAVTVSIRALQPQATESRLVPARLLVSRTGPATAPLAVAFSLSGSATNGVDYEPLGTSVTIPAGKASADIFIRPRQDTVPEGRETVTVTLDPVADYTLARNSFQASARVMDNDFPTTRPVNVLRAMPRFFFPVSTVGERRPERYYTLLVKEATVLNATLTGPARGNLLGALGVDAGFELLDAQSTVLATSARDGMAAESLRRSLPPGTYFLRVFFVAPGSKTVSGETVPVTEAAFQVALSAGPDWDIVAGHGEAHHVGLRVVRADGRVVPPVNDLRCWVITHGRNSSPAAFTVLGQAMHRSEPASQMLLLDWRTAAAPVSSSDLSSGRWFALIGGKLKAMLQARDLTRGDLNLLGHSWGTYVSCEIAKAIGGGDAVSRFIVLDPALEAANYDQNAADFGKVSVHSWAFYSSALGNEQTARTADDAFDVAVASVNPVTQHTAVVDLFKNMLRRSDAVSQLFRLNRVNPSSRAWETDAAVWTNYLSPGGAASLLLRPARSDFEGRLATVSSGGQWVPVSFLYHAK